MITTIIILSILVLVGILLIIFFLNYSKLTFLSSKTNYVNDLISQDLEKKYELIIKIHALIKKTLRAKKDYLVGLNNLLENNKTNQDLDDELNNYEKTINDLISDYTKLSNNKDIKTNLNSIKDVNEKLDASKFYFNKHTSELSKLSTHFPSNIIAKMMRIRIIPVYNTQEK